MGRVFLLLSLLLLGPFIVNVCADVVMTAQEVNQTLKKLTLMKKEISSAASGKGERLFELGVESLGLARLINDEIAAHQMQQKALIDLTLKRTRALGITIEYLEQKQKYFYDCAAFQRYVKESPQGKTIAAAKFYLMEDAFSRSTGSDAEELVLAIETKKEFLTQYPTFDFNAELELFMAIDYRDLFHYFQQRNEIEKRDRYRELTREQFQRVIRLYPEKEQAELGRGLLERFEAQSQ